MTLSERNQMILDLAFERVRPMMIAEQLGVSRSVVNDTLQTARRRGVAVPKFRKPDDEIYARAYMDKRLTLRLRDAANARELTIGDLGRAMLEAIVELDLVDDLLEAMDT